MRRLWMMWWGTWLGILIAAPAWAESRVEWIGVRAVGSCVSVDSRFSPPLAWGAQLEAPTLIWDSIHLYWTTADVGYAHVTRAWPKNGLYRPRDEGTVGTALGAAFGFGAEQRHEIRAGLGMGLEWMLGSLFDTGVDSLGAVGGMLRPEVSYVYHAAAPIAITTGLETTWMLGHAGDYPSRTHALAAFVGLAL